MCRGMESRLTDQWSENDDDDRIQELFWKEFKNLPQYDNVFGKIHPEARIGTSFLKKNKDWLLE